MKKCEICNLEFENHSLYANHIRWKHSDNTNYHENATISAIKMNENRYGKWVTENSKCSNCDKKITIKYRENKKKTKYFCNRSCANVRKLSKESKEKISEKISKLWESKEYRDNITEKQSNDKRFSSKGEREIRKFLSKKYNILPHRNITLDGDLIRAVDILLPDNNTIIEYDGVWHFKKVTKDHKFKLQQKKDKLTNKYCKDNNIKLIRIKEDRYYSNKNKTIQEIINIIDNKNIDNYILY